MLSSCGRGWLFSFRALIRDSRNQCGRARRPCLELLEDRQLLTVYSISGRFGAEFVGHPGSGLVDGSFRGTFKTTLPGPETWIYKFDVQLLNKSGHLVASITSSQAGAQAWTSNHSDQGRDILSFQNGAAVLNLDFASPNTGKGRVIPTDNYPYNSYANIHTSSYVTVASGHES